MKKIFFILIFSAQGAYPVSSANRCKQSLSKKVGDFSIDTQTENQVRVFNKLKHIKKAIAVPIPKKTSVAIVNHSLVPPESVNILFQQMQKDVQDLPEIKKGFFSQIVVHPNGFLTPARDSTIDIMDNGSIITDRWNKMPHIRQIFSEMYKKIKSLRETINQMLPEADINISEVVFTFQYRKPSEGWHSDWYENEYIIATQTFLAQKMNQNGTLIHETNGGTEYFILDDKSASSIQFDIHKNPVEHVEIQGFSYTTPTGWLSIHSGTQRIQKLLGESFQYSISPPHRGAQTPTLEFRGSIAVRYSQL